MAYISFQPNDYFSTKLYTGNNSSSHAITGVGFQPDWTWIKSRNFGESHRIYDVVRGASNHISSNGTVAQTSNFPLTSFDSDGFTIGSSDASINGNYNYTSWNWKAGGSGSSNSDGSVTSTVSASTTSGFSIVKWTANLSSAVTVGHGLGTAPKVIIQKALDQTSGWIAGGFDLDWSGYMVFNGTQAFNNDSNDSSGTGRFFSAGGTEPSSTIFSTNSSALVGSATDVIAYCFAEKKGFSKFGKYSGNNNNDGAFVYLGFKPNWLLIKQKGGTNQWQMRDGQRGFNGAIKTLYTDSVEQETSGDTIDLLSNGFKLRNNSPVQNTAEEFIYMAFAEEPLVSSNGVPATAR